MRPTKKAQKQEKKTLRDHFRQFAKLPLKSFSITSNRGTPPVGSAYHVAASKEAEPFVAELNALIRRAPATEPTEPREYWTWTLVEDGSVIFEWDERNAPGLGKTMETLLVAHAGAWHFAREPMARDATIAARSHEGGAATSDIADERHADLDRLILGCLQRGEKTRDYKKVWADEFNVSIDTVERRVKLAEDKLAKG